MSHASTFRAFVWTILGSFAVCLVIAIFGGVAGCSKANQSPASTPRVLSLAEVRAALPGAICGDETFAQVNSAWLRPFYDEFRAEIFDHGVVKWDARFDCNHFAGYYTALAQTKFYLANFHSGTKAQSLAVGVYWYRPAASPTKAHAIVAALTERGLVFIEPQSGAELALTPAERASAFLTAL